MYEKKKKKTLSQRTPLTDKINATVWGVAKLRAHSGNSQ